MAGLIFGKVPYPQIQFGTYGGGFGAPISTSPQQTLGAQTSAIQVPKGPPNTTQRTGGGFGVLAANTGPSPDQAIAEQIRQQSLAAIRGAYERNKETAGNIRGQSQNTFNDLLNSVNKFRERSGTLRTNAGQEITNRASGLLGENARGYGSAEAKLRGQGRALGLGAGSRLNRQTGLTGGFAALQGNTLARRGEQQNANEALFQERQDEAQGQENQANNWWSQVQDTVNQLLNRGTDQYGTDVNAAQTQYASDLGQILQRQQALAALNPLNAGGLTQFAPNFSGIANTIDSTLAGLPAAGAAENAPANLASDPTYQAYLRRQRGLV